MVILTMPLPLPFVAGVAIFYANEALVFTDDDCKQEAL